MYKHKNFKLTAFLIVSILSLSALFVSPKPSNAACSLPGGDNTYTSPRINSFTVSLSGSTLSVNGSYTEGTESYCSQSGGRLGYVTIYEDATPQVVINGTGIYVNESLSNTSCNNSNGACTFSPNLDVSSLSAGTYTAKFNVSSDGGEDSDTANFTITVGSINSMSGTLTPASPSCTIPSGASSCPTNLSWSITNPIAIPSAITANGMSNINVTSTLNSPQNGVQSVTVPYPSRNFYYYDNAIQLAESDATATCASGFSWDSSANMCDSSGGGSSGPDLTAGAVIPTSVSVNTPTTLNATIYNIGNQSTGAPFHNFFQVATGSGGTGTITDQSPTLMSTLAVGGTGTASVSYTFTSAGTYSARACADKTSSTGGGVITETNENNNCGSWTDINATLAPINGGWTNWSSCSCVNGTGTQSRSCTNPTPENGGAGCGALNGGNSSQDCSSQCSTGQTDAVCGTTYQSCTSGTYASGSGSSGISYWTWTCNGSNGGAGAYCSELKNKPKYTEK